LDDFNFKKKVTEPWRTLHNVYASSYYYNAQVKENEMYGACRRLGIDERCKQNCSYET
jgi:hypothetical protein